VLDDIGAHSPRLLVFNKTDAIENRMDVSSLLSEHPRAVEVSAHSGHGLDVLAERVSAAVQSAFVDLDLRVPAGAGRLLALVAEHGNVLERTYDGDEVVLKARVSRRDRIRIDRELQRLGLMEPSLDDEF
jgi:GTP-binding protein HflX